METPINDGEIKEWITHFRLNPELYDILTELGVELVEDLDTIFQGDESLLLNIRAQLSAPDVDAFVRTYHTYKELVEDNNSTANSSGDGYSLDSSVCTKFRSSTSLGEHVSAGAVKEAKIVRRIEALEKKLNAAATLDLLIMMDCTGSMMPFIDAAKSKIRSFVSSINRLYPDIQLRIAFVGYRDHCDGEGRHVVLPFTTDLRAFEVIVAQQVAQGGGDTPEDIAGALKVASELQWQSALRVMFHIGDAPCHGLEYHDCIPDTYPRGDPYGLQPVNFLQSLHKQKVHYLFGELNRSTDKMLHRFRELLGFAYIRAEPMRDVTMMTVITSSVSSIISESLSQTSSVSTGGDVGAPKQYTIDEGSVPAWKNLNAERAAVYLLRAPASVDALSSEDSGGVLEDFPQAASAFIRCAKNPFARGGNKLAYRACTVSVHSPVHTRAGTKRTKTDKMDDVVLKESVRASKSHQTKEKFEEYMAAQRAALFLAAQYRTVRPEGTPSIEFAPVRLLQFLSRPSRPYFIEESYIPGDWERFNNNTGFCAPFPTLLGTHHEAVQAFSHWTHHVSGGRLMITDCQGCFDAARNAFVLTDPAVHCVSLLAYGGTNMGAKGFERFFKTHKCNDICRALQLSD